MTLARLADEGWCLAFLGPPEFEEVPSFREGWLEDSELFLLVDPRLSIDSRGFNKLSRIYGLAVMRLVRIDPT